MFKKEIEGYFLTGDVKAIEEFEKRTTLVIADYITLDLFSDKVSKKLDSENIDKSYSVIIIDIPNNTELLKSKIIEAKNNIKKNGRIFIHDYNQLHKNVMDTVDTTANELKLKVLSIKDSVFVEIK